SGQGPIGDCRRLVSRRRGARPRSGGSRVQEFHSVLYHHAGSRRIAGKTLPDSLQADGQARSRPKRRAAYGAGVPPASGPIPQLEIRTGSGATTAEHAGNSGGKRDGGRRFLSSSRQFLFRREPLGRGGGSVSA